MDLDERGAAGAQRRDQDQAGFLDAFRQVGIATAIAALGSIFTAAISRHLAGALPPPLAGQAGKMAAAVRQGSARQLLASLPAADRNAVAAALRSSFATALNDLLYITAGLVIVGAFCAVVLIRRKDFKPQGSAEPAPAGRAPAQETV